MVTGKLSCAWVGAWVGAWFGASMHDGGDVVEVVKMHGYTTWIGVVGLGLWGRSGLVLLVVMVVVRRRKNYVNP